MISEQTLLGEKLLLPGSERYEEKRQIWNSAIQTMPAAIVVCENEQDVVVAVNLAKEQQFTIAVKGGGHHIAGFAIAEGSIVLDMSEMKDIIVNQDQKMVEVSAGVRSGELTERLQQHGLAVPLGTASDTGVFGVALGGGMGYLRGAYGLTCDNIIGATVVTADGHILEVNEQSHPDMLWALRGGGGNFGVVTKLQFQAYEVGPEVFALDIVYDFDDAKEIFTKTQLYLKDAPNEAVAVNFAVTILPPVPTLPEFLHFKKVIMAMGMYVGDIKAGEDALQPLRQLATPIMDQSAVMPYVQLQQKLDATTPPRANCYGTSLFFEALSEEAMDAIIQTVHTTPTPAMLFQLWTLGGKMNELTLEHAAFAIRRASWALMVDAIAMNGEDEACKKWVANIYHELAPFSFNQATYLNGICPSKHTTANAYQQNLTRLQEIKQQYDPLNFFKNNHNIAMK